MNQLEDIILFKSFIKENYYEEHILILDKCYENHLTNYKYLRKIKNLR